MKKNYLWLVFVCICGQTITNAQVKIGGDPETAIASGTLLELGDATGTTGGLLLPRVVLTAENANPFGEGESTTLSSGLMVYNLGSETEGAALDEGLYVLQAGLWKPAGGGGDIPVATVSITPNTPSTLGVGNAKQLYFLTSPPNATYPSMSWNSSNTAVATVNDLGVVTGVAPGTTTIALTLGSITSDPVAVTVDPCGSPFTAPSGKVYNTAAYNNANLTNLCWTTTNLQEAGYSATCYMNDCDTYPTRGYYYTSGTNAENACDALNDHNFSHRWHVPTVTNWDDLRNAFGGLVSNLGSPGDAALLRGAWNGLDDMTGYEPTKSSSWDRWDTGGFWWAAGESWGRFWVDIGSTRMNRLLTHTDFLFGVRCVRDL